MACRCHLSSCKTQLQVHNSGTRAPFAYCPSPVAGAEVADPGWPAWGGGRSLHCLLHLFTPLGPPTLGPAWASPSGSFSLPGGCSGHRPKAQGRWMLLKVRSPRARPGDPAEAPSRDRSCRMAEGGPRPGLAQTTEARISVLTLFSGVPLPGVLPVLSLGPPTRAFLGDPRSGVCVRP